jgi:pilus assembly protein TadC
MNDTAERCTRAAKGDAMALFDLTILHQLAEDSRLEIRAVRRQRAGRLPISSLLPVVCCFLPGFLLLTLVPVLIGVVQGLTL